MHKEMEQLNLNAAGLQIHASKSDTSDQSDPNDHPVGISTEQETEQAVQRSCFLIIPTTKGPRLYPYNGIWYGDSAGCYDVIYHFDDY